MKLRLYETVTTMAFAVFALTACGGGGNTSFEQPQAEPVTTATTVATTVKQPVADVTFVDVPTDPNKVTVVSGECDVRLASFQLAWKFNSHPPMQQLVFTNPFPVDLWATFKEFRVLDGNGNDIKQEVYYYVRREENGFQITADFQQTAWHPNDFGVVPETYSLMTCMDPLVPVTTKFAFKLTAVQLHDAGKTVDIGEVGGQQFEVVKVEGFGLPKITSISPAYFAVTPGEVGRLTNVGSFKAECLAEKMECSLEEIVYSAHDMSPPSISVDGMSWRSTRRVWPEDANTFSAKVGYSIPAGKSKIFTIFGVPNQENQDISIIKMDWVIGGRTRVRPIVPETPVACDLMVNDGKGCKG